MTDIEKFRDMLVRAGIKFEEEDGGAGYPASTERGVGLTTIVVTRGYCFFYTNFIFKKDDGSLSDIAAYE